MEAFVILTALLLFVLSLGVLLKSNSFLKGSMSDQETAGRASWYGARILLIALLAPGLMVLGSVLLIYATGYNFALS